MSLYSYLGDSFIFSGNYYFHNLHASYHSTLILREVPFSLLLRKYTSHIYILTAPLLSWTIFPQITIESQTRSDIDLTTTPRLSLFIALKTFLVADSNCISKPIGYVIGKSNNTPYDFIGRFKYYQKFLSAFVALFPKQTLLVAGQWLPETWATFS